MALSKGRTRNLDWGIVDEELHSFINDQQNAIDTYLFGRRMYEVMRYWDTAEQDPSNPEYILEFARIWKNVPTRSCFQRLWNRFRAMPR